jgi:4-hydroxy-tetrahydrodipicolinate synthase
MSQMCQAALQGNIAQARACNDRLQGLHQMLFVEPSPAPSKWALERLGLIAEGIRLPLVKLTDASKPLVEAAMNQAKIL